MWWRYGEKSHHNSPQSKIVYSLVCPLRSGFTVQESMELFSSYLKIPADYLPTEATAIHEECKVMMMMMVQPTFTHLDLSVRALRW